MQCLFCKSSDIKNSGLPPNIFNNKKFSYLRCVQCDLQFINPVPDEEDLKLMYPALYQGKIERETFNLNNKMPGLRFSYIDQLSLILNYASKNSRLLDYGCGNGHFIFNAWQKQLKFDGVEFSHETVLNLKESLNKNRFYTISDFYTNPETYFLIRVSNVLEHFTNPDQEFQNILNKLDHNGYLLIEGPLETNKSLVNLLKWQYFKLRYLINKNYKTNYVPTHIFFSDYNNQLAFFERYNLETIVYKTKENAWPYPETLSQVNSVGALIKFVIGKISMALGIVFKNYGSTFIYLGRKK
jgi:SAM-dependent methyltransferase